MPPPGTIRHTISFVAAVAALLLWWSTSEQVDILEREMLVSQYIASAEMLGNAQVSVRIGAIQALGLLAREQPEQFHIQTMQLLSAFIREPPLAQAGQDYLRADVQAALDVIIYRSTAGLRLEQEHRVEHAESTALEASSYTVAVIDLRGSDLQRAELSRANLAHAVLNNANLSFAHGDAAMFTDARLLGAKAIGTHFPGAVFDRALMTGADMSGGKFPNSSFVETEMPWEMVEADLANSKLSGSLFAGTDLTRANLEHADLSGARFARGTRDSRVLYLGAPPPQSDPRCPVVAQTQLDSADTPKIPPDTRGCPHLSWRTNDRGAARSAHADTAETR